MAPCFPQLAGSFSDDYTVRVILAHPHLLDALATADRQTVDVFFDSGPNIPFIDPALLTIVLRTSTVILLEEVEPALLYEALECIQQLLAILGMGPRIVVLILVRRVIPSPQLLQPSMYPLFEVVIKDTMGAGNCAAVHSPNVVLLPMRWERSHLPNAVPALAFLNPTNCIRYFARCQRFEPALGRNQLTKNLPAL